MPSPNVSSRTHQASLNKGWTCSIISRWSCEIASERSKNPCRISVDVPLSFHQSSPAQPLPIPSAHFLQLTISPKTLARQTLHRCLAQVVFKITWTNRALVQSQLTACTLVKKSVKRRFLHLSSKKNRKISNYKMKFNNRHNRLLPQTQTHSNNNSKRSRWHQWISKKHSKSPLLSLSRIKPQRLSQRNNLSLLHQLKRAKMHHQKLLLLHQSSSSSSLSFLKHK